MLKEGDKIGDGRGDSDDGACDFGEGTRKRIIKARQKERKRRNNTKPK